MALIGFRRNHIQTVKVFLANIEVSFRVRTIVRFLCTIIPLILILFLDMSNVDKSPAIFETITSTVSYRLEVTWHMNIKSTVNFVKILNYKLIESMNEIKQFSHAHCLCTHKQCTNSRTWDTHDFMYTCKKLYTRKYVCSFINSYAEHPRTSNRRAMISFHVQGLIRTHRARTGHDR